MQPLIARIRLPSTQPRCTRRLYSPSTSVEVCLLAFSDAFGNFISSFGLCWLPLGSFVSFGEDCCVAYFTQFAQFWYHSVLQNKNNSFVRLLHLTWHLGFKLETQWMEAHQTTLPTFELCFKVKITFEKWNNCVSEKTHVIYTIYIPFKTFLHEN